MGIVRSLLAEVLPTFVAKLRVKSVQKPHQKKPRAMQDVPHVTPEFGVADQREKSQPPPEEKR